LEKRPVSLAATQKSNRPGKLLALGLRAGFLVPRFCNVTSERRTRRPTGSALSPDGQRIAVGHTLSGGLHVFDTNTGRSIAQHASAHASSIRSMAFSSDGARLATADTEGTIKIWQGAPKLTAKTALVTLKGHQGAITAVRAVLLAER
jgi:WD40 repeat protein